MSEEKREFFFYFGVFEYFWNLCSFFIFGHLVIVIWGGRKGDWMLDFYFIRLFIWKWIFVLGEWGIIFGLIVNNFFILFFFFFWEVFRWISIFTEEITNQKMIINFKFSKKKNYSKLIIEKFFFCLGIQFSSFFHFAYEVVTFSIHQSNNK